MDYKNVLKEYINNNHKNLNQFCKEYELNYGFLHSILNNKKTFEIAAAKTIEDKFLLKLAKEYFQQQPKCSNLKWLL